MPLHGGFTGPFSDEEDDRDFLQNYVRASVGTDWTGGVRGVGCRIGCTLVSEGVLRPVGQSCAMRVSGPCWDTVIPGALGPGLGARAVLARGWTGQVPWPHSSGHGVPWAPRAGSLSLALAPDSNTGSVCGGLWGAQNATAAAALEAGMPCLVSVMNPVLQDGQLQGEAGLRWPKDRVVSGRGSRPSCPGPTWYHWPGGRRLGPWEHLPGRPCLLLGGHLEAGASAGPGEDTCWASGAE